MEDDRIIVDSSSFYLSTWGVRQVDCCAESVLVVISSPSAGVETVIQVMLVKR